MQPRLSRSQAAAAMKLAALLWLCAGFSLLADWPSTNATKWVQFPDARGFDVLAAQTPGALPLIIADDFLCRKTGPITDIHIWASWLGDNPDPALPITLGIWSDVPAVTNATGVIPSHPGVILWNQTFAPGQYLIKPWQTADELFWSPDPAPQGTILGPDHMIWQYNFYPTNPFVQQGTATAPVVYWLSVTAGANAAMFGWKTATNHWNDDAVAGHLNPNGQPLGDWKELRNPTTPNPVSLDMAFALTTHEVPPNPPPDRSKWVQWPQQFEGFDINASFPNIVADDFLCQSAGVITNIQLWASWRDDANPDLNVPIVVGIWSDVPSGSAGGYSHPGRLLWSETFLPGGYGVQFYTNGVEQFYDPTSGQLMPETRIWLYNFRPREPFCQRGSTNNPVVYWLSVSARTSPAAGLLFGWKTSTNHWNDDGVYGHLNAAGSALGDWRDLHHPATGISLDLAFRLQSGPPTRDCDPVQKRPKWVEWPDLTPNGLDVRATAPKVLGDDFLCRRPGPINGVRIWGSWLQDRLDTNVTFRLSLWTDVPGTAAGGPSHPGEMLCSSVFYPPQTVATFIDRYKYSLYAANLEEKFYDPDIPGTAGLIGSDTQIWQYDFYPRLPCWRQVGTPGNPRIYWITLTANVVGTADQYLFGWKTSTNHWNDDGVFGHVNANGVPLGDWRELRDPRTGRSLDLSFALRSFPIVGINKDLKNLTQFTADGVQIVVAGIHEVTFHYDDIPPWPDFDVTYDGGNTVLTWSGKTVAPGAITHIGFEMGATSITIIGMHWLAGGAVVGRPIQVNHHTWGNGTVLTLNNDINDIAVTPVTGLVEFYADPVPLELMNPNSQRTPISSARLPIQPAPIPPGSVLRVPLPDAPRGARYAMFWINLADPTGNSATADFLQLPLDEELRPTVFPMLGAGGNLDLMWSRLPGRFYRLQSARSLSAGDWVDVLTGDLSGDDEDMTLSLPTGGSQGFYRIVLLPE